jgi:hypothetical protein
MCLVFEARQWRAGNVRVNLYEIARKTVADTRGTPLIIKMQLLCVGVVELAAPVHTLLPLPKSVFVEAENFSRQAFMLATSEVCADSQAADEFRKSFCDLSRDAGNCTAFRRCWQAQLE